MAAGDIINWLSANGLNQYVNFQPAAGVEIITISVDQLSETYWGLYDGSLYSYIRGGSGVRQLSGPVGITNSIYWRVYSTQANNVAFSGIQIK